MRHIPGRSLMLAGSAATLLGGCASHLIIAPNPDGSGIAGAPYTDTQVSIMGERGASSDGATGHVAEECGTEGMTRVEVHRNLLQGLVTALTLGTVSPATIRYQCAKTDIPEDPDSGSDTQF
ncbi:hypothetical protein [Aurantiacibacter poecillastricola]|uniref:hypothetical protein n=1 Tax=Aurantiacibacter poecillastricola TaxID=3064385 RepID=UPI00273FA1E8|nr:hypothetical protein [Aurantiacibacter sp. 219JJ12-13]MDP5260842.1 hypothetical protein [Aurantiacibacter sp. 219JJ12-13]